MHDARAVANFFIQKTIDLYKKGNLDARVTTLSLQKLVYIANSLSLNATRASLVKEMPLIGKYDPYFPDLKEALLYLGGLPITNLLGTGAGIEVYLSKGKQKPVRASFTRTQTKILNTVWKFYVKVEFDCTRLTVLTGGTDELWEKTSNKSGGIGKPIEPQTILENLEQFYTTYNEQEAA